MASLYGLTKCPECGAVLKSYVQLNKYRLFLSIAIGTTLGLGVGFWFVSWWFAGTGFTHTMALIHEIAGAVLGGLIGWGVGVYVSRV